MAAIFVLLTKVGFYVVLRLSLLVFEVDSSGLTGFGNLVLLWGGIATLTFAICGMLSSQALGRFAGFSVLVSSGTLLATVGLGDPRVVSGALFYLVSSTLATAALFMLIELVERAREPGADVLTVTTEAYGAEDGTDEKEEQIGIIIPGALAVLGVCFGCVALLLAGLPPLSGFIAKLAMLSAMMNPSGPGSAPQISWDTWLWLHSSSCLAWPPS